MKSVAAEAYRPSDDNLVVERLVKGADRGDEATKALRVALKAEPENVKLAAQLARRYINLNRADGDPRTLGYAQAALLPWADRNDAATEIILLRAIIAQRLHRFGPALADLDRVLSRQPAHPQALLSRAFILQAQGRVAEAGRACDSLPMRSGVIVIATCRARVNSLSGANDTAAEILRAALTEHTDGGESPRLWALTNLAEILARQGDQKAAHETYEAAMALGLDDAYLVESFADFLLDQRRFAAARALLDGKPPTDGVLLRVVLAHPNRSDVRDQVAQLRTRFDASRRRGGSLHLREEARFELYLEERPIRALELVLENWSKQREPWDARLVLEAALAAERPRSAVEVLKWLETTGLRDKAIASLAARLKEQLS